MSRPASHSRVTLVTAFRDDEPFRWGLDLERMAPPLVILAGSTLADEIRKRRLAPAVTVRTEARLDTPDVVIDPLAWLATLAREADPPGEGLDDLWFWLDAEHLYKWLSYELLYSGLIADRLVADVADSPVVHDYAAYGMPVLTGGSRRTLCDGCPTDIPVREVDVPYSSVYFAAARREPAIQIFGDSHVLFSFTPRRAIRSGGDILVRTADCSTVPVPYAWQFSHHLGARTMHGSGDPDRGLTPGLMATHGGRDGDLLLFVFGEIDVRGHVWRQVHVRGRALDEVVATLASRYLDRLGEIAVAYPASRVGVFGVIPPFDGPHYSDENSPRTGSVAERVEAARRLNTALAQGAAVRGLFYFDVCDELAGADGSLPLELSDHFCHVDHDVKPRILDAFYRCVRAL